MGLLNQIDRVRRTAAAALIAEHIYYLILAWFLQSKTCKSYSARTLLVCPVEDGENRLACIFFQQKDTRLPIAWRICHQINGVDARPRRAMSIRFVFFTRDSRSGEARRVGRSSPISNIPPDTAASAIDTFASSKVSGRCPPCQDWSSTVCVETVNASGSATKKLRFIK